MPSRSVPSRWVMASTCSWDRAAISGLSVGEDGVFIVDDQFAPLTDKILAAIAEITSESVRFVFNTHWHGDHTGGNENLGRTGALIVAHENVRYRLSMDQVLERIGTPRCRESRGSRGSPAGGHLH